MLRFIHLLSWIFFVVEKTRPVINKRINSLLLTSEYVPVDYFNKIAVFVEKRKLCFNSLYIIHICIGVCQTVLTRKRLYE